MVVPFLAVALVVAIYFGHKKWNQLKEREEAAFYDLVDKILGEIPISSRILGLFVSLLGVFLYTSCAPLMTHVFRYRTRSQ